ncbi:FimD/PapC C-terminal domain-containing protein, partial [Franconibacter pulveris]|uniref:FimD/PapC C-terminal domain-containing protein n=2 Tax=Franconibacter TaxID=1649295 RepID=UPI00055D1E10
LRRRSGYLITFPMEQERVANVILHDENGQPLPVSSQVFRAGQPPAIVGYDGIAWLENVGEVNHLTVSTPQGKRCTATLTLAAARSHRLETFGPLICQGEQP